MRQAGDFFAEYDAIAADVGGTDLEQIVEAARDHMAFLDLGNLPHRDVELLERLLARVRQFHFGEGDMVEPDLGGIDDPAETDDQSAVDEALHALLARGFRQPDLQREFGKGDAPVAAQNREDLAIKLIQFDC